jgi:hypothetical protein
MRFAGIGCWGSLSEVLGLPQFSHSLAESLQARFLLAFEIRSAYPSAVWDKLQTDTSMPNIERASARHHRPC